MRCLKRAIFVSMGKMLVLLGLVLVVVGLLMSYAPNIPLGRLPGDIRIERENFRFYFPITSCLLISMLVLLILYIRNRIK